MTEEKILEGNKLIAEFMGEKIKISPANGRPYIKNSLYPSHLSYHSSWDWLIPVCHKLDYLTESKTIEHSKDYEYFSDKLDDTINRTYTIEPVFKAVVEFIEWYNLHNPSTPSNDTGK